MPPTCKHICVRHEGIVTIIPDAIRIVALATIYDKPMVLVRRINRALVIIKNVDEIISPYTQQEKV